MAKDKGTDNPSDGGQDFEPRLRALEADNAHLLGNESHSQKTIRQLQDDVRELEHDLGAMAERLGAILGEPFRSQACEIVSKRQVKTEASV